MAEIIRCCTTGGLFCMNVFSFIKPYRVPIAAALMLMLVELAVELWQPLLMAKIIDEGIIENDLDKIGRASCWERV